METLGIKRGLTAVEASYLLDLKPPQISHGNSLQSAAETGGVGNRN